MWRSWVERSFSLSVAALSLVELSYVHFLSDGVGGVSGLPDTPTVPHCMVSQIHNFINNQHILPDPAMQTPALLPSPNQAKVSQ